MVRPASFGLRLIAIVPALWKHVVSDLLSKHACSLGFAGGRRRTTPFDRRGVDGTVGRRTTTTGRTTHGRTAGQTTVTTDERRTANR